MFLEAVRKIKMFENASNSDIQGPLTIFIAGATSGLNNKKND